METGKMETEVKKMVYLCNGKWCADHGRNGNGCQIDCFHTFDPEYRKAVPHSEFVSVGFGFYAEIEVTN